MYGICGSCIPCGSAAVLQEKVWIFKGIVFERNIDVSVSGFWMGHEWIFVYDKPLELGICTALCLHTGGSVAFADDSGNQRQQSYGRMFDGMFCSVYPVRTFTYGDEFFCALSYFAGGGIAAAFL